MPPASSNYKLVHFNTRFLAEPIRFIFAFAGVPYEDVRLSYDEWLKIKGDTPWNQLPILELADGRVLGQSSAIAQFLARRFNLTGINEWEAALCCEISDSLRDLRQEWRKFFFQRNRERKADARKNFLDGPLKKYYGYIEKLLKENGGVFIVGSDVTWADLLLAQMTGFLEETMDFRVETDYPNIANHKVMVWELPQIKAWLEVRPRADLSILNIVVSV